MPGLAARQGAVSAIAAVLDRGRMFEETRFSGDPAERAEARALADLTLRRLGEIDTALAERVPKPPRAPVIHILRVMAAELMFRQTGPHAAVDLAVRQAKAGPGARLAGLVNAVGRRLAAEPPAPAKDAGWRNMAGWLWHRLGTDWGRERALAIAAAHLVLPPVDLSLRTPGDAEALAVELEAEALPTGGLRLAARPQISALPGYAQGAWWVQDAAASLPATLIPEPAGKRVLDLCAAPGGKTMQLAAAGARVTALDISEARMARLAENLARVGLEAGTVVADALDWAPETRFDAVLLDAPCSATGTVRRHPELPRRFEEGAAESLAKLTALQDRLLDRAWDWVAPGGCLVFATCSLLKAEGEDRARAFAARSGAERLPVTGPFATPEGDLRTLPDLWPERGGMDGFFAARFRRPG
ncbi:transcription antitermination factor NusB [Paralimibaculum aggregatum]|uniref:Transcription antitermination factor NusB n=1 Tax=Paralimibaculum aggregatum TaxID=3036245 RepID=A0ABQ6LJH8_9RHOB|nr:RsmB/NOP family class I SAM-dependent RNA methyltransferase [Limibaculum sp. NKW23]GMG83415.1 transcription antitermination factor NusB [Limibaculum sp. NKW23]